MKRCVAIILLLVLLLILLVKLMDRSPVVSARSLEQALRDTSAPAFPLMTSGAANELAALNRFRDFWSVLSETGIIENVSIVYDENIWFNDTLKTIDNVSDLKRYLLETHHAVDACSVEIQDIATSGGNYYVRWNMTIVPKGARAEDAWQSSGVTLLRFNADGLVVLHQDYWDAASGLYEHLPIIGWVVRNIRARL